ncbi:E1B small T-antigen [Mastadenovirus eidoli]|uniref:E1B protein, small T-antigen n=1 Tax=Eidolon helvum adenovirus TaxID=2039267 RepID=A0A348FKF5_9ADEN|nr:E1B small T-antigen [Eidolon helvum adenovirus]BBF72822.1 E1B small T-antigen [Eidolon helvum adenovirus]
MERPEEIPFCFETTKNLLLQTYKFSKSNWFWRKFFSPPFIFAVLEARKTYKEEFQGNLNADLCINVFFDTLDWGNFQNSLIRHLDFSSFGRAVASIAFLSTIIERLEEVTCFSVPFIIESFSYAIWQWAISSKKSPTSRLKTSRLTKTQEKAMEELSKSLL